MNNRWHPGEGFAISAFRLRLHVVMVRSIRSSG